MAELVTQLRFARSEFVRCLERVPPEDAVRRLRPMNSLSWIVGHLASQEHHLWVEMAQRKDIASDLYKLVGYGVPGSTPPLEDMWEVWHSITSAADEYLDTLSGEMLYSHLEGRSEDIGTTLLRNIYHYWYHLGEAHAVRSILGHEELPEFVGRMSSVRHSVEEST